MKQKTSDNPDLIQRARRSLTRIARFTNWLQRAQLSCGPVTVQQCHTLEALMHGPLAMKDLADEMALHQSTLTRVVDRLEAKEFVSRRRRSDNQRVVDVAVTETGRALYQQLDAASTATVGRVLALVAHDEQEAAIKGLEVLCGLLDPQNSDVQALISGSCCNDESATHNTAALGGSNGSRERRET